jgi:glycerophosphoryl diester phosphodiesterase
MMRPALPPEFLRAPLAHRALHDRARGRPENSLPAIRAAVAAGYGIEVDLQLSRDDAAMVFHDEALERLTHGVGLVRDHDLAGLKAIPVRDCAEPIPTLAEVLAEVAGRVPLLIEMKDQTDAMAETDGRLEAATAAALAGYAGPVAVMSFNPHSVARMAHLSPRVARGITTSAYDPADWAPLPPATCERLRGIPDYDRVGASFVSHEVADLARPRVADLKRAGAAILCWTVRSAETERIARRVADNVTFEGYPAAIPG